MFQNTGLVQSQNIFNLERETLSCHVNLNFESVTVGPYYVSVTLGLIYTALHRQNTVTVLRVNLRQITLKFSCCHINCVVDIPVVICLFIRLLSKNFHWFKTQTLNWTLIPQTHIWPLCDSHPTVIQRESAVVLASYFCYIEVLFFSFPDNKCYESIFEYLQCVI